MNWQQELPKKDWKVLMMLDACRFDYFEKHYKKYMRGELKKKMSEYSCSLECLIDVFTKKHNDIIYVSANPYVTSAPTKAVAHGFEFCAKDKFFKVIDVWDFGKNEYNYIPPIEVNKAFLKELKRHPKKRFILHYIQPHPPFISLIEKDEGARRMGGYKAQGGESKKITKLIRENFLYQLGRSLMIRYLGYIKVVKFKQLIGIPPVATLDYAIRKYSIEEIRGFYDDNVIVVLEAISKILPKIEGKVIITSDHGELLGEYGMVGHPVHKYPRRYKELLEVPYLEVRK